jgi:hypothetical protein
MDLETTNDIWDNPLSGISYENYEKGYLDGYRLAFQDQDWYEKNKNNFCNSIKDNFPDILPKFVKGKTNLTENYLNFYPDEFIRFGRLEKIYVNIEGKQARFWAVKMPAGLELYHSSRTLGLNHSDYPLKGYNNRDSKKENKTKVFTACPSTDFMGHKPSDVIKGDVCTYISYYSSPYVTKQYLTRDKGYGAGQVNYAYGIMKSSSDKNINDRLSIQSNEQLYGVQAYKLEKDTYFSILALDDMLVESPDLGRENMNTFKRVLKFLSKRLRQEMNITSDVLNNFFKLIDATCGTGSLEDNIEILVRDYPQAKNFRNGIIRWLKDMTEIYNRTKLQTAGYIKTVASKVNNNDFNFNNYKGIRFSTFEHDRPVMNMLGWLFMNFKTVDSEGKNINVTGYVSSSLFVYSKGKSVIKEFPFTRDRLQYYIPNDTFHSEVAMFFAPEVLKRDKDNIFDIDYSINYGGVTQELRKYKTTNIMTGDSGFHQGHLLEHSTWVGIVSSHLYDKEPFRDYDTNTIANQNIYLIAGYLHDIGKSGECVDTAVYKGLDHQDARKSVCNFVTGDDEKEEGIIGMRYFDIPEHPEKGYEYLKGYKVYKKFTLDGTDSPDNYNKNAISVYFTDWEKMFEKLDVDSYDKRLIRIAAAAHWYFGDTVKRIITDGEDPKGVVRDFIRKLETFHNDEFYELEKEVFLSVILFVIVVSVADILGSEYNPERDPSSLTDDQRATLINFYPNISQSKLNPDDPTPIVDQVISYALNVQKESKYKQEIMTNVKDNVRNMIEAITKELKEFTFNPANNYSLLYNLTESYPGIADIKRAYEDRFPTVISFDLDQTMFAIKFRPNQRSEYYIYPDTYKIMEEVQKVRKKYFPDNPTYIAVTSRHYSPKSLRDLILAKEYKGKPNPLYYENFDYIVSRYTGPESKIINDMKGVPGFFRYNGYPKDGFIMDPDNDSFKTIPNDSDFKDLDKISKYGHFKKVKDRYGINYEDILSFDDDKKYFSEKGLGKAKDVFVAGVLKSRNLEDQGIRTTLFRRGVAFYVFNKLIDIETR